MPVTYTNRKGVTYTLYRKIGVDGKPHHVFGRRPVGEPVDSLPPGFRISESPNGRVSLARDKPSLILPEEIAAVEAAIARNPEPGYLRVATREKSIEIYGIEGPDPIAHYHDLVAVGLDEPGREEQVRAIDEEFAQFSPILRFKLLDPERRLFGVQERTVSWDIATWEDLGLQGDVVSVAQALVPTLKRPSHSVLFPFTLDELRSEGPAPPVRSRDSPPMSIHRLRITLLGVRPPIWRRVEVPSDVTLGELHFIVQAAMGWYNSHLHDFRVGNVSYSDPGMMQELNDRDERTALLADVAPRPKSRLRYTYDFGSNWEHEILVEAIATSEPEQRYPVSVARKRACPPDDCGGVWGYADLLETLAGPEHPEREDLLE
jgi:hypothetical protein